MKYFISDTHFIDGEYQTNNVLNWERSQFKNEEEHNNFIVDCFNKWLKKLKPGDEFYHLGDFGSPKFLTLLEGFNKKDIKTIFVYGNHDKEKDLDLFKQYFQEVYKYPVYLSQKLVISHCPVATYSSTLNVHGHLHGMILNSPNYITCSINDTNYQLVSEKQLAARFSQIEKFNTKFLYEPWAKLYQITKRETDSLILNNNNTINIDATLAYRKAIRYDK